MAHEVNWNKKLYEDFCELAMLSDSERDILRTRIQGKPRTWQMREYSLSQSALDRAIKRIKVKYDYAQKAHPDRLPPRRKSALEDYMDFN